MEPELPPQAKKLLDALRAESRRRRRRGKWTAALAILVWLAGMMYPTLRDRELRAWGAIVLLLGVLIALLVSGGYSGYKARRQLAQLAAEQTDSRVVGPLIMLIRSDMPYPGRQLLATLYTLLPRLQKADDLTPEERDTFAYLLQNLWNEQFARIGLETVARLEDSRALPAVRSLAGGAGIARRHEDIRALAASLVPKLEQNPG